MMKIASALIQCMMRNGSGCSCRFLRPVDLTAGDDIDEYSNLSYLVTTKPGFPI